MKKGLLLICLIICFVPQILNAQKERIIVGFEGLATNNNDKIGIALIKQVGKEIRSSSTLKIYDPTHPEDIPKMSIHILTIDPCETFSEEYTEFKRLFTAVGVTWTIPLYNSNNKFFAEHYIMNGIYVFGKTRIKEGTKIILEDTDELINEWKNFDNRIELK